MLGLNQERVRINEVFAARRRLGEVISPTPIVSTELLNRKIGGKAYLKAECTLPTGAFKFRGAYNKIRRLTEEFGTGITVVTASSGNHGMGAAYASRLLGVRANVVIPVTTPLIKQRCINDLGARVILYGNGYEEAALEAYRLSDANGWYYAHSVADADVLAGQGTISLEILDQLPDAEQVVIPLSGGGLAGGVSFCLKTLAPHIKTVCVQPEHAAPYAASRCAGRRVTVSDPYSVADAVVRTCVDDYLYDYVESCVDEIVTVSEQAIMSAVGAGLLYGKLTLEGAGALPLAAALEEKLDLSKKTVMICSGGNIDGDVLQKCLDHYLRKT